MPGPLGLPFTKVIVAIHGIGDQSRNATVQGVATRIGANKEPGFLLPLGHFYGERPLEVTAVPLEWPRPKGGLWPGVGFAEAYWADLPRAVYEEKHTLEETKAWAKSIVARLQAQDRQTLNLKSEDYVQAAHTLEEAIDTIAVLDNLLFLARKMGVLDFNLREVLDNYLGDVQLVAEFPNHRRAIVDRFKQTMGKLHCDDLVADLYVVAHSEGTVVAFLGLLEALNEGAGWARQVKGFMTLGSPIDKHLVLWNKMWEGVDQPKGKAVPPAQRIVWCNYYDYGDPVGFRLDTARWWMQAGWNQYFDFPERQEFGFSRYLWPGEAHNEYWNDEDVFQHFMDHVVEGVPWPVLSQREEAAEEKAEMPSRCCRAFFSTAIPYLLSTFVLFGGVAFLYLRVAKALGLPVDVLDLVRNVSIIGTVFATLTLATRVPRLTADKGLRVLGWASLLGALGLYARCVDEDAREHIGQVFGGELEVATWGVVGAVLLVAILVRLCPRYRLRWLMTAGGLMLALLLGGMLFHVPVKSPTDTIPGSPVPRPAANATRKIPPLSVDFKAVGPVMISGLGFLYLWWLSASIFDLSFIWHRYIRRSVLHRRVHASVKKEGLKKQQGGEVGVLRPPRREPPEAPSI